MIELQPILASGAGLWYVISKAPIEGIVILVLLLLFSIFSWSVLFSKVMQMRRAKNLNGFFETEYRGQQKVLGIFDRRVQAEGCPLFAV